LYSENKKIFDIGYAFSFAKDHSNLDESQLKNNHQTTLYNEEILLLNITQDEVSEIFNEKVRLKKLEITDLLFARIRRF